MKILWLCGNPGLFRATSLADGGWIGALQTELTHKYNVQLINVFEYPRKANVQIDKNVTYYPIYIGKRNKLFDKFYHKIVDKIFLSNVLDIIQKEKPDIIQCWGSELGYGLIRNYTNIPVILHIQGLLNPYLDAYFPPGYSLVKLLAARKWNLISFVRYQWLPYYLFKKNTIRERKILRHIKYLLGRTSWDKDCAQLLSPQAEYIFCSEALRSNVINAEKWKWTESKKLTISTIISSAIYKGVDVILRTAKLLKKTWGNDFEWNIYGVSNISIHERLTNIKASEVNVKTYGRVSAETIAKNLSQSDVYCHQSYIENSPNSVCEAQYLGVPIVAANAGGMDTIVSDGAGILVPTNDAYRSACAIIQIKKDKIYAEDISKKEISKAIERHCNVSTQLINIYKDILDKEKSYE